MKLYIKIVDKNGNNLAAVEGNDSVSLLYAAAYAEGDKLYMKSDEPGYVVARLEDSMAPVFGYLSGEFMLVIPFGEKRVSYSPKNFVGDKHILSVRVARKEEIDAYKNLAFNVLDSHDNTGFFPHSYANVETRGESVFASRNAIDGFYANDDHGPWPYQSWGINQNPDAEITIDFGRKVTVDKLIVTLRADFPHDNWWHTATIRFSDGSTFQPQFIKTGEPQIFDIAPRTITSAVMCEMKKDENDPSPFPALTQIEFWGHEA